MLSGIEYPFIMQTYLPLCPAYSTPALSISEHQTRGYELAHPNAVLKCSFFVQNFISVPKAEVSLACSRACSLM